MNLSPEDRDKLDDYQQMMLHGGRSPEGWRSVKEGE